MKKILALLGALLVAASFSLTVTAGTPRSTKDSLSVDGPYILYGPAGVEVIGVDVDGNISREHWESLPDGYTFQVTDHRGKYPFEGGLSMKRARPSNTSKSACPGVI